MYIKIVWFEQKKTGQKLLVVNTGRVGGEGDSGGSGKIGDSGRDGDNSGVRSDSSSIHYNQNGRTNCDEMLVQYTFRYVGWLWHFFLGIDIKKEKKNRKEKLIK